MKNENLKTPRTIEEMQKEIELLKAKDKKTTQRIEKELRLEGLSTFDAESVYNELNLRASIMENIAHALTSKNVDSSVGSAYTDCADMVRKAMTDIIRLERYRRRMQNEMRNERIY